LVIDFFAGECKIFFINEALEIFGINREITFSIEEMI